MGGAENITLAIIRNDKKNDHVVLVLQGNSTFQKFCQSRYKIKFHNLNWRTNNFFSISNWKLIISSVTKIRPNIIQSYMFDASKYSRLLGLLFSTPVLIYVVNTYQYKKYRRAIINFILGFLTDRVIVNSSDVEKDVLRYDRIDKSKIKLIPSFAMLDFKKQNNTKLREHLGIKKNDFLLLFIARLVEQKGISFLIDAIHICLHAKKIPNLRLIIVGDGPLRVDFQKQINKLNLMKYIFLAGEKENLNPYLSEADLYIDSSLWSGLSVAAIKAMEASLPLIMTDVGGARQLTNNGEHGYLCEEKNCKALADLIEFCYKNKINKNPNSNKFVKKYFSDTVIAKKIIDIYNEVLLN
jgi:glycosyltransferase involved in cell wall biosynthesis